MLQAKKASLIACIKVDYTGYMAKLQAFSKVAKMQINSIALKEKVFQAQKKIYSLRYIVAGAQQGRRHSSKPKYLIYKYYSKKYLLKRHLKRWL